MIFVTVGTDHHPFDRLIQAVDVFAEILGSGEEVFVQRGSSGVVPLFCSSEPFLSFDDLMIRTARARIVVCHGGPGSIMPAIYLNKVPVVWPREKKYREAVDDHQLDFSARLALKGLILRVMSAEELESAVSNYDRKINALTASLPDEVKKIDPHVRVSAFARGLDDLCQRLIDTRKGRG
ncbi:MAG: hypothetical protein KJ874_09670 [Acidobacteria bacterium]|nr:hypothetical protein [Acidobacteriota bacterium]